jgi:hypothetical protein
VYENLGMEAMYKPQRGFVDKDIGLIIVSDASAYPGEALGPATGVFTTRYPFLRPPRLFDIATEQTRSLRARILMEAIINGRLPGTIVRLGRSVEFIDNQAKRHRKELPRDAFLAENVVDAAAVSNECVSDDHDGLSQFAPPRIRDRGRYSDGVSPYGFSRIVFVGRHHKSTRTSSVIAEHSESANGQPERTS